MKGTDRPRIQNNVFSEADTAQREHVSNNTGLRQDQVEENRKKYGSNKQVKQEQATVAHCIRRAFINPFSIILFILVIVSVFTNVVRPEGYGQSIPSIAIITIMLLLSGFVRLAQELRARGVANRLTRLVQTTVSVRRDGIWQEICSDDIVVGDLVRIDAGDRIPADIQLTDAKDLFVSQAVITGESGSMEKTAYPPKDKPEKISEYVNIVFQGTTVTGGSGTGIVRAVGANTVYGGLVLERSNRSREFDRGSSSIARVLIQFMSILLPLVFLACGITKGNWLEAFLFALSVAVGLTPEMLPMVVNACLARGSFQMGQKQTVVKNINAMQTLGSMDVLCVDKTGTLTDDTIVLEYYMDILGNESHTVLDYAFLNSYYHSGVNNQLDNAILKCLHMPNLRPHFQNIADDSVLLDEQPFDYAHKYVGILLQGSSSNLQIIKGSVNNVVSRCSFAEFRGEKVPIDGEMNESVRAVVDDLTEDGMKVVAVAYKNTSSDRIVEDDSQYILLGYLAFFDAPKKDAAEAISHLKKLNVDVRILSGDDAKTTMSVCSRLGVKTDNVLTGAALGQISENDLPFCVEQTKVFAELTPRQKANIVDILQQNGHSVGFLGDGMNDLPAELKANVGISVDNAADALKEGADVILLKKDLNVLEQGILEGRRAFANMTKYIKITASSNFGNICAVVAASIILPFYPMTSLQLLFLNLLYDILCLIMPWDHVDWEQLQKPIRWTGKNLGRFMLQFGIISSVFDVLTFAFLFLVLCPTLCGGSFAQLDASGQAAFAAIFHTGWFLESTWTQVLILHLLRTSKVPIYQSSPSRSFTLVTIAGIAMFTLFTVTPVGRYLGLVALPAGYYGFLVVDVLCYLLLVSVVKFFYYKKHRELL